MVGLFAGCGSSETTIRIFHTNDIHGAAQEVRNKDGALTNLGFARMRTYIDAQEADLKLLVDAGDVLHGLPFATVTRGEGMARLVAQMGYDALAPGNHDFDYGVPRLIELRDRYELPVFAANLTKDGRPIFPESTVWKAGGVRVGLFALATPETPSKTSPKNVEGYDFGDSERVFEIARAEVQRLRKEERADVVIALTHLGSEDWAQPSSVRLAQEVPDIDLIIDGHSHSALEHFSVDGVAIASAGESLQNLGAVTVTLRGREITGIQTELLGAQEFEQVEPDPEIAELLEALDAENRPLLDEVVSNAPETLDGEREHVRGESTNLGRAVTEAMRLETGADAAIINGGSLRASIPAGPVTRGQLIGVMPFGNYALVVDATGAEIREALDAAMVVGAGSFPQFSGIQVRAVPVQARTKDGVDVLRYQAVEISIGGRPLEDDRVYTVAINDYMFEGGDEYEAITEGRTAREYGALDELLIRYMEQPDALERIGGATLSVDDDQALEQAA